MSAVVEPGRENRSGAAPGSGAWVAKAAALSRAAAFPFGIFLLWAAAAYFAWVPRPLLPPPAEVVARILDLSVSGDLSRHIIASGTRLAAGIALGGIPAVGIGILVGMFRPFEAFVSPTLRFLAPVPVLAWMPLVILFFGIDEAAKIALLAVGVFFVMYSATSGAVRSIDNRFIEVCRLYNKSVGLTVRRIILPASTPTILDGLRAAVALSWIILVAAEIVTARNGLGWLLWDARTFGRTVDAYAAMIVVGLLGLASDILISGLRRKVSHWRGDFGGL